MTNETNFNIISQETYKELINCILPVSLVFSRRQSGMSDAVTTKQGHKD